MNMMMDGGSISDNGQFIHHDDDEEKCFFSHIIFMHDYDYFEYNTHNQEKREKKF